MFLYDTLTKFLAYPNTYLGRDEHNFSMKKTSFYLLMGAIALSSGLSGCASPKVVPQEKQAFERVKSWRSTLSLSSLESQYDLPKGLLSAVMHQESAGKV